jgi:cytoskeleton protein RodZ
VASERPEFELSAPSARTSVGEQLRTARVAMGMSVDSVAKQLKLAPRQVTAIEQDDVASLPSGPFLRGFIRNYARLVKVDPEPLLGVDSSRRNAAPPLEALSPTRGELRDPLSSGGSSILRWIIPAILAAIVLASATWYEMRKRGTVAFGAPEMPLVVAPKPGVAKTAAIITPAAQITVPGLPPAEPVAAGAAGAAGSEAISFPAVVSNVAAGAASTAALTTASPVTAAPASGPKPVSLELQYEEQAWTEIRDGVGNVLTSKTQAKGSKLSISGQPPFRFSIGNARAVKLTRDGVAVDLVQRIGAGDVAKFALE